LPGIVTCVKPRGSFEVCRVVSHLALSKE
jgi:hypothetical protein